MRGYQIIDVGSGAAIDFTLVAATGETINGNQPQLPGDSGWKYYDAVFAAVGAQTKIQFGDAGYSSNGLGTLLDDVSLTETTETPPPPNLIHNGSFEQHLVNDNGQTWQLYARLPGDDAQLEIPHWNLDTGAYIELHRGILGGPAEGKQHAELDASGNTVISQEFATITDGIYQLRFAFAGRPGTSLDDNKLKVDVLNGNGGNISFTLVEEATGGLVSQNQPALSGNSDWQYYTTTFVAPGTQTTVRFAVQGNSNGMGSLLDDVSVVRCVRRSLVGLVG